MPKQSDFFSLQPPEIKDRQTVFRSFFNICCDQLFLSQRNHAYSYYYLETRSSGVVVVAKTKEGQLVTTEEYRHPMQKILLGLPGGYLDSNESPEEGAKRELFEETGYTADRFIPLGSSFPYPGISSQQLHYVLAESVVKKSAPSLEPTEVLKISLLTHQEIDRRIAEGTPTDGIMCTALYLLKLHESRS
jgi:ADP-ribose pyrophosphatase